MRSDTFEAIWGRSSANFQAGVGADGAFHGPRSTKDSQKATNDAPKSSQGAYKRHPPAPKPPPHGRQGPTRRGQEPSKAAKELRKSPPGAPEGVREAAKVNRADLIIAFLAAALYYFLKSVRYRQLKAVTDNQRACERFPLAPSTTRRASKGGQ